jgi:hypothetical protein
MAQSMPRNALFAARTTIGSNPLCQSYSNRQAWLIEPYAPIYGIERQPRGVIRRRFRPILSVRWTQSTGRLPIPCSRPYEGVADGECSGCVPSGPRHVRRDVSHGTTMEKETASERGFRSIPALSRASDADEELAADALKEQGNRSLRCGTRAGGICRRGRVAEYRRLSSIAAAQPSPSTTV